MFSFLALTWVNSFHSTLYLKCRRCRFNLLVGKISWRENGYPLRHSVEILWTEIWKFPNRNLDWKGLESWARIPQSGLWIFNANSMRKKRYLTQYIWEKLSIISSLKEIHKPYSLLKAVKFCSKVQHFYPQHFVKLSGHWIFWRPSHLFFSEWSNCETDQRNHKWGQIPHLPEEETEHIQFLFAWLTLTRENPG